MHCSSCLSPNHQINCCVLHICTRGTHTRWRGVASAADGPTYPQSVLCLGGENTAQNFRFSGWVRVWRCRGHGPQPPPQTQYSAFAATPPQDINDGDVLLWGCRGEGHFAPKPHQIQQNGFSKDITRAIAVVRLHIAKWSGLGTPGEGSNESFLIEHMWSIGQRNAEAILMCTW